MGLWLTNYSMACQRVILHNNTDTVFFKAMITVHDLVMYLCSWDLCLMRSYGCLPVSKYERFVNYD